MCLLTPKFFIPRIITFLLLHYMSFYFNLTVMATKTAKQCIYGVKEKQRLLVAANKRNLFIADAIQQDIYKAQEIERVLELQQKSAFTTIKIPLPLLTNSYLPFNFSLVYGRFFRFCVQLLVYMCIGLYQICIMECVITYVICYCYVLYVYVIL